jgi:hypothetical protein
MSNSKMTWQNFKTQLQQYPEQILQFQYAADKLVATDRGATCGTPAIITLQIPAGMENGPTCTPGGGCC